MTKHKVRTCIGTCSLESFPDILQSVFVRAVILAFLWSQGIVCTMNAGIRSKLSSQGVLMKIGDGVYMLKMTLNHLLSFICSLVPNLNKNICIMQVNLKCSNTIFWMQTISESIWSCPVWEGANVSVHYVKALSDTICLFELAKMADIMPKTKMLHWNVQGSKQRSTFTHIHRHSYLPANSSKERNFNSNQNKKPKQISPKTICSYLLVRLSF